MATTLGGFRTFAPDPDRVRDTGGNRLFTTERSGASGGGASLPASFREFSQIFGRPTPATAPTVGDIPTISAPTVQETTVQVPGGSFERLEESAFEGAFRPVQRELDRQLGLRDRELNAALAQAGLAESGVGIGQRERQAEEFGRREQAAAQDAASTAAQLRAGAEISVAQQNAQLQQQARLAQANFDFEAQRTNAGNVLQGNLANAQLYLSTLQLNAEQASQFRRDFLGFFSDKVKNEIARDQIKQQAHAAAFDAYLREKALELEARRLQQQNLLALGQLIAGTDARTLQPAQGEALSGIVEDLGGPQGAFAPPRPASGLGRSSVISVAG